MLDERTLSQKLRLLHNRNPDDVNCWLKKASMFSSCQQRKSCGLPFPKIKLFTSIENPL